MRTAEDDSVPVPHDAIKLPRALLNWKTPPAGGVVWSPQRDELEPEDTDVSRVDLVSSTDSSPPPQNDALDDEPTRAIEIPIRARLPQRRDTPPDLHQRVTAYLDPIVARTVQLWRDGPLRTGTMVVGAALLTYLAVGGVRRGADKPTQTVLVPAAALPAAAPIIVEQLDGSRQRREPAAVPTEVEQSDKPGRRSSSSRTRATSFATPLVSKGNGYQVSAPSQSKPKASALRSSSSVSTASPGLPAWGAEAVRDFSSGKSSASANVTSRAQALTPKPTSATPDIPPPMSSYRSSAREQPSAAPVVVAKPVVAAKPVEPPKPVAAPRPSKPLTMDQVLNQVEEAAQAQRKQAGLKAPKASKRDEELDDLITGAMKSKAK